MRILHVTKKFPDLIGGDASAVDALARTQSRAGHEVFVVTSNTPEVRSAANVFRVGPRQTAIGLDRVTLKRVRTMLALRRWSRSVLLRMRLDVIHSHSADLGFAVAPEARRLGIPRIHTCHGLWFPVWGARSVRGRVEIQLLRRGAYHAIATVDRVAHDALLLHGFPRVALVPNGVDAGEFEGPRRGPDRFRFIFVGRHEPQKGLDVLLDAISILRREGRAPFDLLLLGNGSLTSELQRRVRELGVSDVVTLAGPLDRASVVRAYLEAGALVLPSRFEGFPIAILEAWAAGLPVVATSVGGIPEVCGNDNAILVPPGDARALAVAMGAVLRDPALRERLGSAGRRLVRERFTWAEVSSRYLEIYANARSAP